MQFKDVEYILALFEQQPGYKQLLTKLPLKQFFSLQNWPTVQKKLHRYMIFWLHRPPMLHSHLLIDTEKSFRMSIGFLHYVLSDTLPIGYLVELPKNLKLEVTPYYISAIVGKVGGDVTEVKDLPPAQQELNDQHLSVFVINTTQMIAAKTENQIDFLT